jgi:hypothetical protein
MSVLDLAFGKCLFFAFNLSRASFTDCTAHKQLANWKIEQTAYGGVAQAAYATQQHGERRGSEISIDFHAARAAFPSIIQQ